MKTSLSLYNNRLNLRTYIKISIVAIIIYVLVLSKQLPQAKANDVIQIANCDSDLDQADTIYQLTDNIVGNCTITANNITIDGQFQFNITGNVIANGLLETDSGFDITLQNLGMTGYVLSHGAYVESYDAGNGGNITLIDSNIFGPINASGGYSLLETSGYGGTVTLINSTSGNINAYGGPSDLNGGNGGNVTLTNSTSEDILVSGGNSFSGTGGNAGSVTLTNSTSGDIRAYGGYSNSGIAGNGGIITLTDSTTSGFILLSGGSSTSGTSGNGGTITLTESESGNIFVYGGNSYSGTAGNGGTATLTDSISGAINSNGGDSSGSGGGIGGDIELRNSTSGVINSNGGDSETGMGSHGGDITLLDSSISGAINSNGGDSDYFDAGYGGTIIITDSSVTGDINANGGNAPDGSAGIGGFITLSNSDSLDIFVSGGINSSSAARGGNVTLTDSISENIFAPGGLNPDSSDGGGDGGTINITNSTVVNINAAGQSGGSHGGDITIVNSTIQNIITSGGTPDSNDTAGNGGEVTIEDSSVTGNINTLGGDGPTPGTIGELIITDNPPILTTPSSTEIEFNEVFDLEQDLSAIDIKDGDLTNEIQITGIVGEEAGEYEIEYEVSDLGTIVTLNGDVVTSDPAINTVTANITITRLALPEQPTQTRRTTGSTGNRDNQSVITEDSTIQDVKIQITSQERQGLIEQLRSKLQTIFDSKTQTNSGLIFTRNLDIHDTGDDVRTLQQFLISKGYSIPDGATGYFGFQTWIALRQYQIDNDIIPASGYFGPVTRGFVENN
jgi:hypothetical protein